MLLERLFENLAIRVEPFAVCEVAPGWRLRMEALDRVTIHFVVDGEGTLRVGRGPRQRLGAYTLAIVPPGLTHALESGETPSAEATAQDGRSDGSLVRFVAGPPGTDDLLIACGRVEAVYGGGLGLFDLMRDPVVLDFSDSDQMRSTFDRLLAEHRSPSPASTAMVTALMNECLVLVFRRLCGHPDCHLPWLDALEDPRMAAVLEAILEDPARPFTLDLLAERALMGRSAFAEAFHATFGRTPMAFVREVRLRRAADILRSTRLPVDSVAVRVGFASRSHFSRAFRKQFGLSPTAFRARPA